MKRKVIKNSLCRRASASIENTKKRSGMDGVHESYNVRDINHIAPQYQGVHHSAQVQQQGFQGDCQRAIPALHFGFWSLSQSSL